MTDATCTGVCPMVSCWLTRRRAPCWSMWVIISRMIRGKPYLAKADGAMEYTQDKFRQSCRQSYQLYHLNYVIGEIIVWSNHKQKDLLSCKVYNILLSGSFPCNLHTRTFHELTEALYNQNTQQSDNFPNSCLKTQTRAFFQEHFTSEQKSRQDCIFSNQYNMHTSDPFTHQNFVGQRLTSRCPVCAAMCSGLCCWSSAMLIRDGQCYKQPYTNRQTNTHTCTQTHTQYAQTQRS